MVKFGDAVRVVKSVKIEHARKFAQHVVPEVVRPARVIWNQAIGAIFLVMASTFLWYAVMHRGNAMGLVGGLFLGLVMVFFGVSSFLQARRISRR